MPHRPLGPQQGREHSRLTPTWFLVATTPHNPAVDAWLTTLTGHLANLTEHHEGKNIPYYLAHCSLSQAYLTSTHVRRQLDSMVHEYMEGDCKEMLEPAVVADLEVRWFGVSHEGPGAARVGRLEAALCVVPGGGCGLQARLQAIQRELVAAGL